MRRTRPLIFRASNWSFFFFDAAMAFIIAGCPICSSAASRGAAAGYNRVVRVASALLLVFGLAGCNRGVQNKDVVRQAVLDYLASRSLNVASMNVELTSVRFNGNQADASVSLTLKGGNAAQAMSFEYHLEQKGNKWVVVGRKESGSSPHGAAGSEGIPHGGGAMPAPGAGGKMPAPEDLPPAGQKK